MRWGGELEECVCVHTCVQVVLAMYNSVYIRPEGSQIVC